MRPHRSRFQLGATVCVQIGEAIDHQIRRHQPAILSRGGLGPSLKTLARRCTVPVDVHFDVEQPLPESAEVVRIEISSPAGIGMSLQAAIPFDPAVGQVPPPA
jgi:hypothetical protein